MNNKHILDLTLRLSQSLDQNYDVVSMETVLSVISALEGTTITKEQLEATRLAKYINQLRRRTKCENLARRAKSLLKKWREMVGIQQSSESSSTAVASGVVPASGATVSNAISAATAPYNMPVTDNAVSTSHLKNPQISHQQQNRQNQYQTSVKQQQQIQQQPYHSQPSSPVNLQDKSNPNDYLISMSNPATGSQMAKSSNTNIRKKKRLEKSQINETITQQQHHQQQPTSFANLITGLGNTFPSERKTSREKCESVTSTVKPVETFIIEHSSNSNSDLICIPSNNTVSSNFTSATDVPPVVIDLQDTNSSMNSLVSKDVTNASSSFYKAKTSAKKSKKEKKRKDRNVMLRQNPSIQDSEDQNTTTASYHHKRASDVLLLDEKSHSACPTISNISEILSLSNSSMSSVFPSTDAISKNVFQSGQNELVASAVKMTKADLTFAGKFKQNTSSTSGGCNVVNYNSDSMNVNILTNNSPNQKFSLFGGGIGTANSNDSSSNSRNSQFNVVNAIKPEASNSKHNIEDTLVKPDINEKSMSNMSNKGNSSTDNLFAGVCTSTTTQSQQQQSIDLTTMDFSSQQTVKQPKKRGRKKGSKGVDSVIAKETSLSSQMLISSLSVAGKKVKTTKELYAEMENRKLRKVVGLGENAGNSSGNWITQQPPFQQKPVLSRRPSFCSDIAESDSCTMTSEPSRDSGNILSKTIGKRETPLDNNSNYSELKMSVVKGDDSSTALIDPNSTLAITTKIKQEIQEILKLLTPPPSVKEIEHDCYNNITPCTCTVEEVIAPAENDSNENTNNENSIPDTNSNVVNSNTSEIESNHAAVKEKTITADNRTSEKDQKDSVLPQTPPKIQKSIFDLDFDDDEDPLKSIIADIVGKNLKPEAEVVTNLPVADEKPDIPLSTDDDLGKVDHQTAPPNALNVPTTSSDLIVFPSYEIKFDKDCEAKNRFDVQTQKITKFHIDTLHNCFIPNVNGNWNHSDLIRPIVSSEKNSNGNEEGAEYLIMDGYDVVPLYGSDINEQIIKDLSHVKFTKKYKFKHTKCKNEILFHIPFLGVSRTPDVTCVSDVKLGNKYFQNVKLEEEKENDDNKINLNNTNAILHNENDGCDAKEMERVQNVNSSNFINLKTHKKSNLKRSKEHKTLKRSRIKRLKSTISHDENHEVNLKNKESPKNHQFTSSSGDDSDSDYFDDDFVNDHNYVSEVNQNDISQEQDSNEFHHEVVNHDINEQTEGKNHIVLIIKKTAGSPSFSNLKTNSPLNSLTNLSDNENSSEEKPNLKFVANEVKNESNCLKCDNEMNKERDGDKTMSSLRQHKRLRKKRIKRKTDNPTIEKDENPKQHNTLFYHEELCPIVRNGSHCHKECIFQISSCSSGCSADEDSTNINLSKKFTVSSPSSSSSGCSDNKYEGHMLNLQQDIVQSEFLKRSNTQRDTECGSLVPGSTKIENQTEDEEDHDDDLPEENNHMLLSFNNICNKYTREENAENPQPQENKDHEENNMLKQQLQNCDDYNNLNNNFNLIKYIDNKTSSVNNINNNNNSCSNNYSDTNIILSSSSCSHKNPTNFALNYHKNLNNNDNNDMKKEQIKPLKEYQTGIRAVDEDVNDDDGNNCGRLQQFKEWHEVLQLRSYNDELLTVLPYVVLE